jgi:hypothetical protein
VLSGLFFSFKKGALAFELERALIRPTLQLLQARPFLLFQSLYSLSFSLLLLFDFPELLLVRPFPFLLLLS